MLHKYCEPEFDKIATKYNQTILYTVPWPTQYLHLKVKTDKLDGLKGMKIRVPDRQAGDMVKRSAWSACRSPGARRCRRWRRAPLSASRPLRYRASTASSGSS